MTRPLDEEIGKRISRARRRLGLTQLDLAAQVGVSESWISQLERGVRSLDSLTTAEKIAGKLGIPLAHLLAMDIRQQVEPPPAPWPGSAGKGRDEQDWTLMLRRMFMTGAAGLAAGTLTEAVIPPSAAGRPVLDAAITDDLHRIGGHYRRSYRAVPSESLLPLALGQIRLALSLQPAAQPDPTRAALLAHTGQMAALAATIEMLDLGDYRAADALLRLAGESARTVADPELTAVVHGVRAFHAAYSGDVGEGLDWAQAGIDAAERGASPRTQAWVNAVASEMHASLGEEDECHRALEAARRALTLPPQDERWCGIGWLDETKVDAYEGGGLMRLGRYGPAIERLTGALEALEPSMARHRATALVDRADAFAASGQVEDACRDAGEALETVARVHHAETLRRISLLARSVRGARTPAARALREHLMDVRSSLPSPGVRGAGL